MQYLSNASAAASATCELGAPLLPVITTSELAVVVGTTDVTDVVYEAASGDKLPYGGSFYKENACDEVSLVVSYLVKDNACDACAVDTNAADDIQELPDPIVIPAGVAGITIPAGWVAKIEATVVGGSAKGNNLSFMSSRAGVCNEVAMA